MRIWVVAGEYPSPAAPGRGPFVADQVAALRDAGHEVHVVESCPPSLRPIANAARPRVRGWVARWSRRRAGAAPSDPPAAPPPVAAGVDGLPSAAAVEATWEAASVPRGHSANEEGSARSSAGAGRGGRGARAAGELRRLARGARIAHDAAGIAVARRRMLAAIEALAAADGLPEVIHAHNVFPAGLAAEAFGAAHGVPYVVTEHSTAYLRGQYSGGELRRARRVLGGASAVIAVSTTLADGLPVPRERVRVVPNVVLVDDFRVRDAAAGQEGPIVSIGRLTPHKRMDLVLRAYAALPEQVRSRHALRIIGSGPERERLAGLVRSLRLPEGVLVGQLDRREIASELAAAALLVSASAVETFGVTMIEALASGVPFVATDSGGPRDIAGAGLGTLVTGQTPEAIASAIVGALREQAAEPASAESAVTESASGGSVESADRRRREVAVERYGSAALASRLVEIYGRVSSGPARSVTSSGRVADQP